MFELDNYQKEAAAHAGGPCLVIAGPGSGKTAVIVNRVLALVRSGAKAGQIAVLTFTRAAAGEMEERYNALCRDPAARGAYFGTFHSLCFMILRAEKRCGMDSLIGDEERRAAAGEAVSGVLAEDGLASYEDTDIRAARMLERISRKKSGLPPEEDDPFAVEGAEASRAARMEAAYEEILKAAGKIDFDDMILDCLELLRGRPAVLDRWRKRFRWILIDEAQDMNAAQLQVAELLTGEGGDLFEVGDDDQSVYGFRGVTTDHMLDFKKDHPDGKVIKLPYDYRSAPEIVDAAGRLISHNKKRIVKTVVAVRPSQKRPVNVRILEDEKDEARYVAGQIMMLRREGLLYQDIAVLCRTSSQFRPFLRAFADRGIPCYCPEKEKNTAAGWIEEDLEAWDKLISDMRRGGIVDRGSLLRALKRPPAGLGAYGLLDERVDLKDWAEGFRACSIQRKKAERFIRDLDIMSRLDIEASFIYFWNAVGYGAFARGCPEASEMSEALIRERAEKWKEAKMAEAASKFSDRSGAPSADHEEEEEEAPEDAVSLITMHASKGLEFAAVFVPTLNEGTVPHTRAGDERSVDEERRLMYVAVTRAKDLLFLSYVRNRHGHRPHPSRFLEEMYPRGLPG